MFALLLPRRIGVKASPHQRPREKFFCYFVPRNPLSITTTIFTILHYINVGVIPLMYIYVYMYKFAACRKTSQVLAQVAKVPGRWRLTERSRNDNATLQPGSRDNNELYRYAGDPTQLYFEGIIYDRSFRVRALRDHSYCTQTAHPRHVHTHTHTQSFGY